MRPFLLESLLLATLAAISPAVAFSPRPRLAHPSYVVAHLDKGFSVLELSGKFVPQGQLVKSVKAGWNFVWRRMMAELAPQVDA